MHPSYLLWVCGTIAELSDEPHHDPANSVIARQVTPISEAQLILPELERLILVAALAGLEP